ncbi:MAG: TerD family protein [Desulfovibrio sp.]|nr:TerD family protein [Desulfovibrio sp.]
MINLQKGQKIELGLEKVGVGLGWNPSAAGQADFDLDASAFMLGENHKLPQDEFFVFYNNLQSPDGAVSSSGDDLTGAGSGEGEDAETILVDLTKLDPRIQEIIFTATIHKAEERRQNFGQVRNAYIRIYNALTGEEIAKYDLEEDFSVETGVEFGRIYRKNGVWKFDAMGIGNRGGLQFLVDKYVG